MPRLRRAPTRLALLAALGAVGAAAPAASADTAYVTDQNVGGAVMTLQQSIVMGAAMVALFLRLLGEAEQESRRAERYAPRRAG